MTMILVIDNYDSFTWNLVQLIGELGADPVVKRNDEVSLKEIERMAPQRIVISPGPCTPAEAGISVKCIQRFGEQTPILGVCLGHQAIGAAYGGRVVRANRIMHGKVSPVEHSTDPLFDQVPNPITVARYHSLIVERESLPSALQVTAWTAEPGWEYEIQGLRHERFPVWGVQFHPESVASQSGKQILQNFLNLG
jgi:anthranilate synthase/aminodeoxychorismate synthase-like glutamine amidotransferase